MSMKTVEDVVTKLTTECPTDKPENYPMALVSIESLRTSITSLLEHAIGEADKLKSIRWIEHGRDCREGRRPCGGDFPTDKLADRCETRCYDNNTIEKVEEILRSLISKE